MASSVAAVRARHPGRRQLRRWRSRQLGGEPVSSRAQDQRLGGLGVVLVVPQAALVKRRVVATWSMSTPRTTPRIPRSRARWRTTTLWPCDGSSNGLVGRRVIVRRDVCRSARSSTTRPMARQHRVRFAEQPQGRLAPVRSPCGTSRRARRAGERRGGRRGWRWRRCARPSRRAPRSRRAGLPLRRCDDNKT